MTDRKISALYGGSCDLSLILSCEFLVHPEKLKETRKNSQATIRGPEM